MLWENGAVLESDPGTIPEDGLPVVVVDDDDQRDEAGDLIEEGEATIADLNSRLEEFDDPREHRRIHDVADRLGSALKLKDLDKIRAAIDDAIDLLIELDV
jgi:hypothetical protein